MSDDEYSFRSAPKTAGSDDRATFGDEGWSLADSTNVSVEGGTVVPTTGAIPDSVVSRWRFEDDSDTSIAADSEGAHDGTITGATYTSDARENSHALLFSDPSDEVNANWVGPFADTSFSVALWLKNADVTSNPHSALDTFTGSYPQVSIQNHPSETIKWRLVDPDGVEAAPTAPISSNTWYHVVGVRDGDEARLYVDGSLVDSVTDGSLQGDLTNGDIRIGYRPDDKAPWDGPIDDVMVADSAWTDQQVSDLYNSY